MFILDSRRESQPHDEAKPTTRLGSLYRFSALLSLHDASFCSSGAPIRTGSPTSRPAHEQVCLVGHVTRLQAHVAEIEHSVLEREAKISELMTKLKKLASGDHLPQPPLA